MQRIKRGGRRHKVLTSLAAHPDGLISRQLAEQDGENTGQKMLTSYGDALRDLRNARYIRVAGTVHTGRQNTPAIVYQITDAGRKFLAAIDAPRPAPPKHQRAEYPWVDDAARRNHAGESIHALSRDYNVADKTVERALERRGIPVRRYVEHPRKHTQPEWAAEAARRYRNGETRLSLCETYGVADRKMIRVLEAEGVTLRSNREVRQLSASARHQGQEPDRQPDDPASSSHDRMASDGSSEDHNSTSRVILAFLPEA